MARYCISLTNALHRLQRRGELPSLPLVEILVQSEGGTNPTLGAINPAVAQRNLDLFGTRRKTQNVVTEFFPQLAARTSLRSNELIHETYFANLGSPAVQRKVATIHDVIPLDFPEYFNRNNRVFSKRNFERQTSRSDAVIAVSRYTKQRILELSRYPEDKIHVIGCGVDAADARVAAGAQWPISGVVAQGAPYVLYVGNVEPRKNIRALIDAWQMLGPANADVRLVVAGKFNYLGEATIAAGRELLGERFAYVGAVSEADKWALIQNARALVLPSLYEGYGIPIIEAYVVGTLALFSRNSSMTELAHDERQMFDPTSPADIAAVVSHAMDSPPWVEEARARARDWVSHNSWDDVAREVAGVYSEVLGR